MSNLLKGFNIAKNNDDKRVVDCNAIISEILQKMKKSASSDNISDDGFNPRLNPLITSELLSDDEHIIGGEKENYEESISENENHKEKILQEAKSEADFIINKANEDARAIISQAQAEADFLRNQAKEQGYTEGTAKATEQAVSQLKQKEMELELLEKQLMSEYEQKKEELEPVLVDVILKLFSEITQVIALDKRDMILTLVNNVMAGGEASRNFVIRVCNEDAIFLKENKEKIIGAARKDIHIEIVVDPSLKRNQCLIDTDTGVYDCSLDIQLENLINDIKILSRTGE